MRLKIGILLLLLPSLLLAGVNKAFTVNTKSTVIIQPLNTIDRVSKRQRKIVVFEHDSLYSGDQETRIYAAPIHWGSAGVWKRYNFEKAQTAISKAATLDSRIKVDYDEEYNVGPFKIELLSTKPGKLRYSKRGTSLEFTPAYDSTNTKTVLTVSRTGIKEVVELTSKSPTRLAYSYTLAGHDTTKALKEGEPIYGADGMINGFFPALTASDQHGENRAVAVTITADSLIAVLSAIAEGDTVRLDPAVQDTIPVHAATTAPARGAGAGGTNFATVRNADEYGIFPYTQFGSTLFSGTDFYLDRYFLSFVIPADVSGSPDSVTFVWEQNTASEGTWEAQIVEANFVGATGAVGWFDDIVGYSLNNPYNVTSFTDTIAMSTSAGVHVLRLNTAGENAVVAAAGDTLRAMFLDVIDILNIEPVGTHAATVVADQEYLVVYSSAAPPGGPASVAGITGTPASVAGLTSRSKTAGIE